MDKIQSSQYAKENWKGNWFQFANRNDDREQFWKCTSIHGSMVSFRSVDKMFQCGMKTDDVWKQMKSQQIRPIDISNQQLQELILELTMKKYLN